MTEIDDELGLVEDKTFGKRFNRKRAILASTAADASSP